MTAPGGELHRRKPRWWRRTKSWPCCRVRLLVVRILRGDLRAGVARVAAGRRPSGAKRSSCSAPRSSTAGHRTCCKRASITPPTSTTASSRPVIVVTGGGQPGDRFTEAAASAKYLERRASLRARSSWRRRAPTPETSSPPRPDSCTSRGSTTCCSSRTASTRIASMRSPTRSGLNAHVSPDAEQPGQEQYVQVKYINTKHRLKPDCRDRQQ